MCCGNASAGAERRQAAQIDLSASECHPESSNVVEDAAGSISTPLLLLGRLRWACAHERKTTIRSLSRPWNWSKVLTSTCAVDDAAYSSKAQSAHSATPTPTPGCVSARRPPAPLSGVARGKPAFRAGAERSR